MLAMMADGCAEIIVKDDNLHKLLQHCVRGLQDTDDDCRKSSCEYVCCVNVVLLCHARVLYRSHTTLTRTLLIFF